MKAKNYNLEIPEPRDISFDPYRNLLVAILVRAAMDLRPCRKRSFEKTDAWRWVAVRSDEPWTFDWVLNHIDWSRYQFFLLVDRLHTQTKHHRLRRVSNVVFGPD